MSALGRLLVTGASGFIGRDLVAASGGRWLAGRRGCARSGIASEKGQASKGWRTADLAAAASTGVRCCGAPRMSSISPASRTRRRASPRRSIKPSTPRRCGTLADAARERRGEARRDDVVDPRAVRCVRAQRARRDGGARAGRSPTAGPSSTGERLLAAALEGSATDWCVLRPVLVYGPGVKGNMATLVRLARSPLPLPLGSLAARRSLLGLANLHAAVDVHALTSPAAHARTFLVADPGPLTVPEMRRRDARRARPLAAHSRRSRLAPLQIAAAHARPRRAWQRIAGDLVVSTAALEASGWRPIETAEAGHRALDADDRPQGAGSLRLEAGGLDDLEDAVALGLDDALHLGRAGDGGLDAHRLEALDDRLVPSRPRPAPWRSARRSRPAFRCARRGSASPAGRSRGSTRRWRARQAPAASA